MKKILMIALAFAFCANTAEARPAAYGQKTPDYAHKKTSATTITPYFSVSATYGKTDEKDLQKYDLDDWGGLRLAFGASTKAGIGSLRAEIEATVNSETEVEKYIVGQEKFDATLSSYSVLANVYYDIDTNTKFSPYVGAGLGFGRLSLKWEYTDFLSSEYTKETFKDSAFAWQVGAGFTYQLSATVNLDVGYRHMMYGDFEKKDSEGDKLKAKLDADEFSIGVRFAF